MVPTACATVEDACRALSRNLPIEVAAALKQPECRERSRAMTNTEREVFNAQGNVGELRVCYEDESLVLKDLLRIHRCEFPEVDGEQTVLFQRAVTKDDNAEHWKLADTTFENCFIERGVIISKNARLVRCIVFRNAVIRGCGLISGPVKKGEKTLFGNGISISPGLESGGRAVSVVAESTLEQLARVSLDQFRQVADKAEYDAIITAYCEMLSSSFSIFRPFSRAENSPEIIACYLAHNSVISSGSRARNSTLMESVVVEQGSDVIYSLLQANAHVSTQSIVRDSLICEGGSVDVQGKLLNSILGPGSHLAEGEITSSLVGPMVGFHHQSMLIATYWPSGRGNVGYGANCGSNHTSRVSDQTMWPGEGVFFGLGSCMKFPLNLSEAPYTVIATGVVYGPGRLSFPFSLVTSDEKGCRVAPGWGFISNAYAIERNSNKMKARAPKGYTGEIFRPSIASLVYHSLNVIHHALRVHPTQEIFYDSEPLNLAGGYTTRKDLEKAVTAYRTFLELYALRGALEFGITQVSTSATNLPVVLAHDVADTGLSFNKEIHKNHVQAVLYNLFPADVNLKEELAEHEERYARSIYRSKERDHTRGRKVFPPGRYDEAIDIKKDTVIIGAMERSNLLKPQGKL